MIILRKCFSKKDEESRGQKATRKGLAVVSSAGVAGIAAAKSGEKIQKEANSAGAKLREKEIRNISKNYDRYQKRNEKASDWYQKANKQVDKSYKVGTKEHFDARVDNHNIWSNLKKESTTKINADNDITDKATERLRKRINKKAGRARGVAALGSAALGIGTGLAVNHLLKKKNLKRNSKE